MSKTDRDTYDHAVARSLLGVLEVALKRDELDEAAAVAAQLTQLLERLNMRSRAAA